MAWRDRLLDASYRGVPFRVESHDSTVAGRRAVVHEYPGRDTPYAEDLGRVSHEWRITGYVVGPDYDEARDRLIEACGAAGPADLVHPYLGTVRALCTGCTVSERSDEGGVARLRMTFVSAGDARYPAETPDTGAGVRDAADRAGASLADEVAAQWPA